MKGIIVTVGPSTTVIDIPFKQCYTIKFTAKILPWWRFCSAVFFLFLRSQLFLYTLQESTAVMHDECIISIHYMHDK